MTCSAGMCARPPANSASPVLASSTANPSRPPKQGLRGHDAAKQVKGRKRHLLVDTLGLILAMAVTAGSVQDRDGAKSLLGVLQHRFSRLCRIWADQAYAGALVDWVRGLRVHRPVVLQIVPRATATKSFIVLPKRWIVERTLGWFNRYRRLSKDYEFLPETSESMIRVAMIHLMVRRIARMAPY